MRSSALSAVEEHYPRIAKALCEAWGQEDCEAYLFSLVFDARGGRQGFPLEVAEELMLLSLLIDRRVSKYEIWREVDSKP